MQFVLTEIVARLVALYLCVDCIIMLRDGFAERKIEWASDWIHWIAGAPNLIAHRDTMPIRYWALMVGRIFALAACAVVAIFGWWVPGN